MEKGKGIVFVSNINKKIYIKRGIFKYILYIY